MNNKFNAISLFSGMGGDSLAITQSGGNLIAYNEFDKHAVKTHELNLPSSILIKDDTIKKNITDGKYTDYHCYRPMSKYFDTNWEIYKLLPRT